MGCNQEDINPAWPPLPPQPHCQLTDRQSGILLCLELFIHSTNTSAVLQAQTHARVPLDCLPPSWPRLGEKFLLTWN
jgi:hypothetical protein